MGWGRQVAPLLTVVDELTRTPVVNEGVALAAMLIHHAIYPREELTLASARLAEELDTEAHISTRGTAGNISY